MTRRYRIVHTTLLHYSSPVGQSHNEIRMTPLSEAGQTTLESRLRVRPLTWSNLYRDYWGTHVTAVETLGSHQTLEIESVSTVEREDVEHRHHDLSWKDMRGDVLIDLNFEWLAYSTRTRLSLPARRAFGEAVADLSPRAAMDAIVALTRDRITYERGATHVMSTAQDAWDAGRGVCQDLAHVVITAARSRGIPCRYVSGYVTPARDDEVGAESIGESHAWVEWWDGAWIPLDPTNLDTEGLDHIVVARGRDYDDLPPFKGVYQGVADIEQEVSVRFTRLAR